jgi:hypothetical protein
VDRPRPTTPTQHPAPIGQTGSAHHQATTRGPSGGITTSTQPATLLPLRSVTTLLFAGDGLDHRAATPRHPTAGKTHPQRPAPAHPSMTDHPHLTHHRHTRPRAPVGSTRNRCTSPAEPPLDTNAPPTTRYQRTPRPDHRTNPIGTPHTERQWAPPDTATPHPQSPLGTNAPAPRHPTSRTHPTPPPTPDHRTQPTTSHIRPERHWPHRHRSRLAGTATHPTPAHPNHLAPRRKTHPTSRYQRTLDGRSPAPHPPPPCPSQSASGLHPKRCTSPAESTPRHQPPGTSAPRGPTTRTSPTTATPTPSASGLHPTPLRLTRRAHPLGTNAPAPRHPPARRTPPSAPSTPEHRHPTHHRHRHRHRPRAPAAAPAPLPPHRHRSHLAEHSPPLGTPPTSPASKTRPDRRGKASYPTCTEPHPHSQATTLTKRPTPTHQHPTPNQKPWRKAAFRQW